MVKDYRFKDIENLDAFESQLSFLVQLYLAHSLSLC